MRRISHPNAGINRNIRAGDDEMNDVSRPCDTHPDLVNFSYPLLHLKAARQHEQKLSIVAIGSSSTAGVAPVLPLSTSLGNAANAIFHDNNRAEVAAAIEAGLVRLAGLPADVVLMDLQYTQAMVDKLEAAEDMVSRISIAAERAKVNVFRRFALMRRWVDDYDAQIGDLEDGADSHLHTGEWATNCVSKAFGDAIALVVAATGTT
jgi:hypothetical protein